MCTDTFETSALHIIPKQPGHYFLQCDFKNSSSGSGCAILIKGLMDNNHIKVATQGREWKFPGPLPQMSTMYDVYVFDWAPSPNSTMEFYGVVFISTLHIPVDPSSVTTESTG